MVQATRASAPRAAAPPSPNQSLAKHNRKPSQLIENNHQRPKSIASFCRVFCNRNGQVKSARPAERDSRNSRPQILIGSDPLLETAAND
jgi:hypothetical protein